MSKEWNEASIREEIAKLDEKTGLNGAALPIRFGKAKRVLGCYIPSKDGSFFRFSKLYFKNPDWP